jgi:hypothetical protein
MKGIENKDYFNIPADYGFGIYQKKLRRSGKDSIKGILRLMDNEGNESFHEFYKEYYVNE